MEQKLQYIVDKIGELNIQINEKQAEQFFRYYELLVEWNGFMNLTGITDFEEVVKLDTEYIRNWSMGLDFRILFKTVAAVLKRDGSM